MKIEIKNKFTTSVIFKLDAENNSVAFTLEVAIKDDANLRHADLRHANLRYANLRGAKLRGANLRYADLRDADLRCANLRDANLRDADLRHADLRHADLRHADLRGADLREAIGNRREVRSLQVDTHNIVFTESTLQIGCKRYTHKEWDNFTDEEISKMDSGALEWWKKWKAFVFMAIKLSFSDEGE